MARLHSFRDASRRRRTTFATQLAALACSLGTAVAITTAFSPIEPQNLEDRSSQEERMCLVPGGIGCGAAKAPAAAGG